MLETAGRRGNRNAGKIKVGRIGRRLGTWCSRNLPSKTIMKAFLVGETGTSLFGPSTFKGLGLCVFCGVQLMLF